MKKLFMMTVGGLALLTGSVSSAVAALSPAQYSDYANKLTRNLLAPNQIAEGFKKLSPNQINGLFDRIDKIDNSHTKKNISNNLLQGYVRALQKNQLTKEQIIATFNRIYTEKENLAAICAAHIPAAGDDSARRKALAESSARLALSVSPTLPKDSREGVVADLSLIHI